MLYILKTCRRLLLRFKLFFVYRLKLTASPKPFDIGTLYSQTVMEAMNTLITIVRGWRVGRVGDI